MDKNCNGLLRESLKDIFQSIICVDLAPANAEVFKCDFLSVAIGAETIILNDATFFDGGKRVKEFEKSSLKCVVFCYLLSYIPDPALRLQACIKGLKLLSVGGVLLLLTPDSSSQQKHYLFIRNIITGFAAIGAKKIRYRKEKHYHALVFMKISEIGESDINVEEISKNFWIPHDRHTAEDFQKRREKPLSERRHTTHEEDLVTTGQNLDYFNELPMG